MEGEEKTSGEPSEEVEPPVGTVLVPGGRTKIGVEQERWKALREGQPPGPRHLFGRDAHPPFWAEVDPFFLDKHPVTVTQFRSFVEATSYVTQADSFGNAGVLKNGQWTLVEGAT
jgi:sulfatase modifying factor 1